MADEVGRIFRNADNFTDAKNNLRAKFDEIYNTILKISEEVARKHNIPFVGMDFSPAPYPKLARSIGYAVEKLGFDYVVETKREKQRYKARGTRTMFFDLKALSYLRTI